MNIGNLLQNYLGGGSAGSQQAADKDFDEIVTQTPQNVIADGLAASFRSDQTPPFPQMLANLFSQSDRNQRASILNQLLATAGPALLSQIPALAGVLGGNRQQVTPEEAERITPEAVQEAATRAEQRNPSIVDRISEMYSQQPQLFKTLGAAALTVALAKIAQRQFPGR